MYYRTKGEVCTKLTFKNPSLGSASDVFVYYIAVFDNQICINKSEIIGRTARRIKYLKHLLVYLLASWTVQLL